MMNEPTAPRQYLGVMISSTFRDLEQHRAALMKAIAGQSLHPVAMEQDAARPASTVIDSSLEKVRDAAAYIGVIGHSYGSIPDSAQHNPERFSLTELEFREARRLGRPMLIFIMGADHDVKLGMVERDPEKMIKLEAFREEVKRATADSRVHRVYKEFNSLHEFEVAAPQSVAELRRLLDAQQGSGAPVPAEADPDGADDIPQAPELYAEPRYIGSHSFVGRAAELAMLTDWAQAADSRPVLLFEAIGGTGKSMLTWEWTVNNANSTRMDWAGTFWYSFYEKGAVMSDFSRRALAYMTGQPLKVFRKKRQRELTELLLRQLRARPWLLVLDGLERVLVAYHRYDAAQVADEAAGHTDEIGHRDPAAAIRPEDDDLLRGLADASPSKILITSRLVPQVLLNQAGRPLPGVRHEHLAGLHPVDAEALLRGCGVSGDSGVIRDYLRRHCDCHPLVTGIVAGLVHGYLPARGDFDAWAADPGHGGRLNLAELDIVQKRNHILQAAVTALPDQDRQLLSTLALLSESADYRTLAALNPHLPPEPERPALFMSTELDEGQEEAWIERVAEYERNHRAWLESAQSQTAERGLTRTIHNLERCGLLQYDKQANRYDLHPVVRGYASGRLDSQDRDRFGQRVVDHFSQQTQNAYDQAETLDDVRNGLQVVRTLILMGRMREAFASYRGELSYALFFNLEANAEVLSTLRPFFTGDWTSPSAGVDYDSFAYLSNDASAAFYSLGQLDLALAVQKTALRIDLKGNDRSTWIGLARMAFIFAEQNRLAMCERFVVLELRFAELTGDGGSMFRARLERFRQLAEMGRWAEADAVWQVLDPMGRTWPRALYRPGLAEEAYARFRFWQGQLTEDLLEQAEQLAKGGRNRPSIRSLHGLRAEWRLERQEWTLAEGSLHEAIRMTREAGLSDTRLETRLALARFRLGQFSGARQAAIQLSSRSDPAHLALAELWLAIGDGEQAAEHAQAAYRWAWADGEPYVHAYELGRATALLEGLGAEVPVLPAYDPAQDPPLGLEAEVEATIRELRAEQEEQTGDPG
jgi:uncharacterized protein DUF4062